MEISSLIMTTILSIFTPVIASALTIIVKRWIDEKIKDMEDKKLKALIEEGTNIILDSVNFIQQTYVDNLKEHDFFDSESHKEALCLARDRALTILPQEIYEVIEQRYGNVDIFVETVIESYIAKNKKKKEL
jgi:hypothetical protein